MRILYIGHGHTLDNAAKYYFTPQKLVNGFTRLGHSVYTVNDRDVARYANIWRSQKCGKKAMNQKLLQMCREYKPHLVTLGHCKNVTNDTLDEMRKICPGVKIMYRNVDPLHSAQNVADIKQRVGHVDSIFITTAGDALAQFSHPKTVVGFFPNPVDPAVEDRCAFANPDADIDFLFLGSVLRDQHDHRAVTARYLIDNKDNLNIHIGGAGVNDGRVFGAAYYELLERCKMGLCMNKTADYYLYASGRMSQYMASGLLGFIPKGPQFEDVLGEDSFVSYEGDAELLDKIKYFAANDAERIRIARNGYERVHDYWNVDKVCQYMIERTFDVPLSMDYKWPVTAY